MGDRLRHRKRQDGTEFDPSWFGITLAQVEGQPKHIQKTKCVMPAYHIKSSVSSNYQVHLDIEPSKLTAGKYVLIVEALWNKCASNPKSDYQAFCV